MNINTFIPESSQQFDEYIMVAPGSDYGRVMWSDIELLENGTVLDNVICKSGKLMTLLHHIHFSFTINNRIQVPFQHLWKKHYSLEYVKFDPEKKYCVIYTDISAGRTDMKYLNDLSRKQNVHMVLIMVNMMAKREGILRKRLKYFSVIFTFDKNDAKKNGFIYHPTNYSRIQIDTQFDIKSDAFYVGVSKGRYKKLAQIHKHIVSQGGNADFYISGVKKREPKYEGIHYNEWLDYDLVLKHIRKTNCIIEVMEGEQEGITLRTMEAICYNKRLLTNNLSIKNLSFYSSGFIQIFSDITDIDVDFIKDRSIVEYHYNNEFSPIHLLEHINSILIMGR